MKGIKLYLLIGVLIAAVVVLAIFYQPLMGMYYNTQLSSFEYKPTMSFDTVSNAGITGFVNFREGAIPMLVKNLESEDENVRIASIIAMGRINPTQNGKKALLEVVREGRQPELRAAVWALVKHKKIMEGDMKEILKSAEKDEVKIACAKYFNLAVDESAAPLVAELLKSDNLEVRYEACKTLQNTPYPPASADIIDSARKFSTAGKDDMLMTACTTLVMCSDSQYAAPVFEELKKNDVPKLLEAARKYVKRLTPQDIYSFVRGALTSDNPVEQESATIVSESLPPGMKNELGKYAVNKSDPDVIIAGLELLQEFGKTDSLPRALELMQSSESEVASAAVIAVGKIAVNDKFGDYPRLNDYKEENSRNKIIEAVLSVMKDREPLRRACSQALRDLCAPDAPVGTDYESWKNWWDDFNNTKGLVAELVKNLDKGREYMNKGNTRENLTTAKEYLQKASASCEKLEEIATRNEKIVKWVNRKRDEINKLLYVVNKSKPLDVMK
ncbi:MAG: HEAT repeat domain-containing protein [Planctomycetota bacterium]|nr:HEAT repeat domain-containing protein [Planctomycetota bacterium]